MRPISRRNSVWRVSSIPMSSKAVEKAIKTEMDKTVTRMDEKMSEIKMLCIIITLFLNGLLAMAVLMVK